MNTFPDLYDFVMANLRSKRIPQREVASGSGVPFSTVTKIAQGQIREPSVQKIQALADYFLAQPAPPIEKILTTTRAQFGIEAQEGA